MARAIWSGSINFGLVNVPVKVYSAVHQQDLHFSQFEGGSGAKIRYKRVSEKSGREVPYEKIVKGYEVGKDKFVLIDPEELDAFEPRATRTIDIEDFVDLDDIDPIYFEHTYYLAPADDSEGTRKAYALLLRAMEEKKKVGIGRVVMRTKQYLAAIRPMDGTLAMSTMLFADEVVEPKEIDALPDRKPTASKREVDMAGQIIDALSAEWKPARYKDTYRERVLEYIERKAEGEELVSPEPEQDEKAEVVDLMAALEASLSATRKKGAGGGPRKRRAPAKKTSTRAGTKKAAERAKTARKRTTKSA